MSIVCVPSEDLYTAAGSSCCPKTRSSAPCGDCTAWFTLEVILRFVACPSKLGFWRDFKNIVDVVAIVPYYVTLFNVLSTMSCAGELAVWPLIFADSLSVL